MLGRTPDLIPNAREAAWQLREGAWIVLIEGDEQALPGTALHTLLVDDLDGFLAAARERAVELGPVEPVGPDMRQSVIADPDGNRLKVAAARAAGDRT